MLIRKNYFYRQFIIFCASLFIIMKIIRAFSGNTGSGGGVWNLIQVFYSVVGLFCCLKYYPQIKEYKLSFAWLIPYTVFSLLLSFTTIDLTVSSIFSLLKISYFLGTICIFYWVFKEENINGEKLFKFAFYGVIIITTFFMFRYYNKIQEKGMIADIYFALALFPFILSMTREKYKIIPIISLFIPLILTGKRAGIICFVLSVFLYYLYKSLKSESISWIFRNIIIFLIVLIILFFILFYLQRYFNIDILSRMEKLSQDGGSGRDVRWEHVLNVYFQQSSYKQLFGVGKGNILNLVGGHAHNDFLEILLENGIINFVFYILFWISWIKRIVVMKRNGYENNIYYCMLFIISLFIALFSFFAIDATYVTCSAIGIAYFECEYVRHLSKNNC